MLTNKHSWQIRALLFDMDGTLVDSTPCIEGLWTHWALRHQLDPAAVLREVHGRRGVETIRIVAPHLDAEQEVRQLLAEEARTLDGTMAMPGAADFLAQLAGLNWAVVTSAPADLARAKLQYAGLPLPARLIGADEVSAGKPDPAPYLAGAASCGVAASECLAFEDAASGIASACAAGMPVIVMQHHHTPAGLPHPCIASFAQLALTHQDGWFTINLKDAP
ncbi:HAD-IA family hydrolase [Chitinilyticum piscinae]|uniref:HAD-IA family hydrolase n=1 Tax=Chitinilyticum piscinae TaxID=2866724 RepID=A0A8J7FIA2_9NEIS|nr:HAD-IA family hydrolase [Chitinilyticum piscinae]MBE9609805.1 HAD-IA family hydrolase [Chitinilyticum piscinae]